MSDKIDRFKKRQAVKTDFKNETRLVALPSAEVAEKLSGMEVDQSYIDSALSAYKVDYGIGVTSEDADDLFNELVTEFDKERLDKLLSDSGNAVLQSIVIPFGLGKVLSVYDKTGGNVDTINNVRNGVYATNQEKTKFESNEKYNSDQYHEGDNYKVIGDIDIYTGQTIQKSNSDKFLNSSIEHIIPASKIHKDAGRILAETDGPELANSSSNLGPVSLIINTSKNDDYAEDFIKRHNKNGNPEKREKKLNELRNLENPTEHDLKNIKRLEQLVAVKPEMVLAKDKIAQKEYNKKINIDYYAGGKFAVNTAMTSGIESGKMGAQQAFGLMLVELFAAVFDEVRDWHSNGMVNESVISELGERFKRVGMRVASKWSNAVDAFKGGAVSGFISNIVTTLINVFMTTAKQAVRMIREGTLSLLRAIKLLVVRPDGMTHNEAMHESLKILVAGGIVVGGVALEIVIAKQFDLIPVLNQFSDIGTAVVVGSITALASVLAVYAIDKADFFGVNNKYQITAVNEKLDNRIVASESSINLMLEQLDSGFLTGFNPSEIRS